MRIHDGSSRRRVARTGLDTPEGPAAQARAMAWLFAGGGAAALLTLAVPHGQDDTTGTLLTALSGFPVAAVLIAYGHRLPLRVFPVLLALGSIMVGLGVGFGHHSGASISAAFIYVWVALFAFQHFSSRLAYAEIGFALVTYGVSLALTGGPAAPGEWVITAVTSLVTGIVVSQFADRLRAAARIDPLTGLVNRTALHERLAEEIGHSRRSGAPLCAAVLDLDGFKPINDRFGHQAGDALLVSITASWSKCLRARDTLARSGGDEFVLVLPDTTIDEAHLLLARLGVPHDSWSAGVAAWQPGEDGDRLIGRADSALYEAKRSRREHAGPRLKVA